MSNSYGSSNSQASDYAYGVYDTINGEWTGTFFHTLADAQEWVKTQDDEEFGEDWTEGGIYSVISTTDDQDVVF